MKRIRNRQEQAKFLEERRKFLSRAGLLFAGMGVAPATRFELIWDMGKKLGFSSSSLLANELNPDAGKQHFVIYYALRSGTALDASIAALAAHSSPLRMPGTCNNNVAGRLVARHLPTPDEHLALPSDNAAAPAALTYWARALKPTLEGPGRKVSMASTFSIANGDGHVANHSIARGGVNGMAPHPALLLAHQYGSNAMYSGFFFRNGIEVELHRGGATGTPANGHSGNLIPGLSTLGGGLARAMFGPTGAQVSMSQVGRNFLGNFSPTPLPVSNNQALQVVAATKKFNERFISGLNEGANLVAAAESGGNNLIVDLRNQLLPSSQAVQAVMPNAYDRFRFGMTESYSMDVGESTFLSAMSFALGGTKSNVIAATTGDWHGYWNSANAAMTATRDQRGSILPAQYGTHFAEIIASTYELMSHFPNPNTTDGSSVADHLTFVFQSEFGRSSLVGEGDSPNGLNCGGNNNYDGGRAFVLAIGPNLKQGSYGNVNINTGAMMGFHPQTGAAGGGLANYADAYKTVCAAIGIRPEVSNQYLTDGSPWPCWLKS
jgi:hypothetical protein